MCFLAQNSAASSRTDYKCVFENLWKRKFVHALECETIWEVVSGIIISLLFLQTWFFVNYVYNWYKFRYELCATLLLLYTNILTLGYSMYCRYYYHKWACDYFLCDRWCFYFVNVRLFMVNSNTVNRVLTCCVPHSNACRIFRFQKFPGTHLWSVLEDAEEFRAKNSIGTARRHL